MKVHSTLGNGFQEVIYQRALELEMTFENLSFQREMEMPIFYREQQIETRRVDFFVEDKIMVEIKAIIKLEDVHLAQAINYFRSLQNGNRFAYQFWLEELKVQKSSQQKK